MALIPTIALDIETTKAEYGSRPIPICVCLVSDDCKPAIDMQFWGEDCIEQSTAYLLTIKRKCLIIAHNGGKFDFGFYTHDYGKMRVVGSRLLESSIAGHKTLDTFLLMPTSLKNLGAKWETDLDKHRLDASAEDRKKILDYCTQDCRVLLDAYKRFCKVFTGAPDKHCKATAASNAFRELKATMPEAHPGLWQTIGVFDALFRPYYHGGIVHTFGSARDITGSFTMVDANSMYPAVMKNYMHPASNRYVKVVNPQLDKDAKLKRFPNSIFFIRFSGYAELLPLQGPTGLVYGKRGEYFVTSHELQAMWRHGSIEIDEILEAYVFVDVTTFGEFVDKFYGLRQACKKAKDPVEYVYKIVLNSAYGKFGTNPDNYSVNSSTDIRSAPEELVDHTPWRFTGYNSETRHYYWECDKLRDPEGKDFVNVATAASITGAARACLIDAISAVQKAGGTVHYCDTDSITFEGAATMDLGNDLGQWKVECELDRVVIAAPKLYAMRGTNGDYKIASKGVRASADDIIKLVAGEADIEYFPEVGSHNYTGEYRTTKRTIKRSSLK